MAQTPRHPPTPPDPNAGRNIHGQPNRPEPSPPDQVNVQGPGPQPNMAPPPQQPSGIAENTRAEMDAGKRNLEQYSHRDDAEHETGRKVLEQHTPQERTGDKK